MKATRACLIVFESIRPDESKIMHALRVSTFETVSCWLRNLGTELRNSGLSSASNIILSLKTCSLKGSGVLKNWPKTSLRVSRYGPSCDRKKTMLSKWYDYTL